MGLNKISFIERLQLLTMYAAGFEKEAQDYALKLGCTKNYAAALHAKMVRKLSYKQIKHSVKWLRAISNGKVEI